MFRHPADWSEDKVLGLLVSVCSSPVAGHRNSAKGHRFVPCVAVLGPEVAPAFLHQPEVFGEQSPLCVPRTNAVLATAVQLPYFQLQGTTLTCGDPASREGEREVSVFQLSLDLPSRSLSCSASRLHTQLPALCLQSRCAVKWGVEGLWTCAWFLENQPAHVVPRLAAPFGEGQTCQSPVAIV